MHTICAYEQKAMFVMFNLDLQINAKHNLQYNTKTLPCKSMRKHIHAKQIENRGFMKLYENTNLQNNTRTQTQKTIRKYRCIKQYTKTQTYKTIRRHKLTKLRKTN